VAREVPQVYLIHGSDEVKVHNERARLTSELLPREHRAENLTEIEPPLNRPLSLRQIAADLMSELATPSFFPEIRRVVVVEQLADLLGSPGEDLEPGSRTETRKTRKKPASANDFVAPFCRFLEHDLPQTNSILILSIVEEPEKRRRIRTNSPLYQTIQSLGRVVQFNQPVAIFQFLDAFSNRDLATALRLLANLLREDDGPASVFRMLVRQVRFLIQAKLLEHSGGSKSEAEQFAAKYFPPEKGLNLTLEHSFPAEKACRAASRWSLAELNALLLRLERLTKVIYPSINDAYVPDVEVEIERLVLETCNSAARTSARL